MAKYIYPAIFEKEEGYGYNVRFPDVDGCYTCGQTLIEAFEMAVDVLALMLFDKEETGKAIPEATPIEAVKTARGEFVSYITCDTKVYRRSHRTKAVKKTLSIPEWMNEEAVEAGLNFSKILQEAIAEKLNGILPDEKPAPGK
ncbi:MAG: type II toxin-antitoxin system HicB family antitoxin [Firmicutes bacterium]|nr:type II toxin-antitoxin system HicB family antitoxin [Bacillota bacterium]